MAGYGISPNPPVFSSSRRFNKIITFGPATTSGTSTGTSATTLTDTLASWTIDAFIGLTVYADGKSGVVTTNSATVITVASWTGGTPGAVKTYMVGAAGINGNLGAITVGTVTGLVQIRNLVVEASTGLTDVAGGAQMSFGVTGNTGLFVPTAGSVAAQMVAGAFWNASGGHAGGAAQDAAMKDSAISANIIMTIAAQLITGGVLNVYSYWDPITTDGDLE